MLQVRTESLHPLVVVIFRRRCVGESIERRSQTGDSDSKVFDGFAKEMLVGVVESNEEVGGKIFAVDRDTL